MDDFGHCLLLFESLRRSAAVEGQRSVFFAYFNFVTGTDTAVQDHVRERQLQQAFNRSPDRPRPESRQGF